MIQYHVYPEGKKRIVTFSYDDGCKNDERLIELFNKYNLKASFHLNGGKLKDISCDEKQRIKKLYSGHEISCHTLSHGWAVRMPVPSLINEVINDRKILEDIAGYPVVGMSYPFGSYSDEAVSAMKTCGIVYSRTIDATKNFDIPYDFMKWHPSCHHNDAMPVVDDFISCMDKLYGKPLLYIWGHAYEFRSEDDWNYMEEIVKKLSFNDNIWYATNIEIYNYVTAQKMLQISIDEKIFYNPTATDVWVEKDKTDIIKIPAGEIVKV